MRSAGIIFVLLPLITFVRCGNSSEMQRQISVADSLAGSVGALSGQLQEVDTAALEQMTAQYELCMSFIAAHVCDTIGRSQADQLQRFSIAGRQLVAFRQNRRLLLERSSAILKQLRYLTADASGGNFSTGELNGFVLTEQKNVGDFTIQAQEELRLYHSAVKQFNLAFPAVSELVKSSNQGRWPSVIADTAARL